MAIVCEEAGESLQAALNIIEFEERIAATRKTAYEVTLDYNALASLERHLEDEIVSTAAMAIRWLMNAKPLYAEDRSNTPSA